MTQHWHLVHLHKSLITTIDALMCDQSGSSDHVLGHAITNEQDDILGRADGLYRADVPLSDSL